MLMEHKHLLVLEPMCGQNLEEILAINNAYIIHMILQPTVME